MLTLPYLQALRRLIPHAQLDFLTRAEVADIPKSVALFDRIFEIGGARSSRRQLLSALALVPRLSARRYDVVIDLQRNRVSRLVRVLLRPQAWSEFDRYSPQLAGERTRATIEAVGLGSLEVYPDLVLRDASAGLRELSAAGWDGSSTLVVLNPAGAFAGRQWPAAAYARFAQLWLRDIDAATQFVVLGLSSLRPHASALHGQLGQRLLDLTGRTSAATAFALVRRASFVLSEDSGLMHMAWVAGTPTLALFGASSATWSRPHGNYADCMRACRRADGECIEGRCRSAPPPCLHAVAAEAVLARARTLLARVRAQPKIIASHGRSFAPALDG